MNSVFDQPPWWHRIRPWVAGYDAMLVACVLVLMALGVVTMYSAVFSFTGR